MAPVAAVKPTEDAVPMEQFFKAFFGQPPTSPYGPKFKPSNGRAWQEHTLVLKTSAESEEPSKKSVRPMARGRPAPPKAEEPKKEEGAPASSTTSAAAPAASPSSSSAAKAAAAPVAAAAAAPEKKDRLPIALLFPGQGSQHVGMLKSLQHLPEVQSMLKKAQEILGYDLLQLCLEGPEEKLEETRFCQPAMFVAALAGLEKLRADREEAVTRFTATAGLSLGEYTALCAAGVFTFEDGLKLVKLRGQAMQDAAGLSKQAMLSVAGLDKETLVPLCKQAVSKEGGKNAVCEVVNELFPKGYACAGTAKAIEVLKTLAEEKGALQARPLKTSGGFHTRLMAPAQKRLGEALDETLARMQPPRHTVYMNATAKPVAAGTEPAVIVGLLKTQLCSPVLWEQSMKAMIKEGGVSEFYEVGPMKQLKAMMKRIDMKACNATTNVEV